MITKIDFALEEYKTLRQEISDKMGRIYTILSLGVGGITIILGFVFEYKLYELFFVLPFLILANSSMYKVETNAIINAGAYIKKIENSIYREDSTANKCNEDNTFGDMGWENHIERDKKRKIYKPHEYAADILFCSLYIMCVAGVWAYSITQLKSMLLAVIIIIPYIIIAILFWGYNKIQIKLFKD